MNLASPWLTEPDADYALPGSTGAQLGVSHLATWEEANIPPNVTLRALTTNTAELLGVDKDRGAIRPGLAADLIATPGNPLDDVADAGLGRVSLTLHAGTTTQMHHFTLARTTHREG